MKPYIHESTHTQRYTHTPFLTYNGTASYSIQFKVAFTLTYKKSPCIWVLTAAFTWRAMPCHNKDPDANPHCLV